MKKFLLLLLFIPISFTAYSQVYGNEWISFDQSYFKLRIWQDGLYRLSYSTLQQFGVPVNSISGNTFRLYNKGKEIPIYVTNAGIFNGSDYIEFFGKKNDGEWDSALYVNPVFQGNDRLSLFEDTAWYYLTWNQTPSTHHITSITNDLTNAPPKEPFCWQRSVYIGGSSRLFGYYAQGAPTQLGLNIYQSDLLAVEGYMNGWVNKGNVNIVLNTPHVYPLATAVLRTQVNGGLEDVHYPVIAVNGNSVYSGNFIGWHSERMELPVNASSWVTSPTSTISFSTIASPSVNDFINLAWVELQYPREFDFDYATSNYFSLSSSGGNQYVEITNFNENGTTPVLYDLTNRFRLEAVVQNDTEKFVLPPGVNEERFLVLTANDSVTIRPVDSLWKVTFTNFADPANQGNFIIISHPKLYSDSLGNNYVEQYRQWKNATGWQAISVNILDLYDQFAYGTRFHTAGVRKFAQYILNKWPAESRYFFLIGKGIEFTVANNAPYTKEQCLVPTFGYPGSDALLTAFGTSPRPLIATGRIPCITGDEVGDYLSKAKEFVAAQTSGPATIAQSAWMKNVIHLSGGTSLTDQQYFLSFLNAYKTTIEDTSFGGRVFTFSKNSTDPIQFATNELLDSLISAGVSLITFFGHSSYNSFDFNLDKPEEYNNNGKYPLIVTNGCLVGNLFNYGHGFADDFVLTKDHGAIGFLGPSIFSVASSLDLFCSNFYQNLSKDEYHLPIGDVIAATYGDVDAQSDNPVDIAVAEQMLFAGDPSLLLNTHPKPDYALETQNVTFDPPVVSAGLDSFFVQVVLYNIGKATDDTVYIDLKRTLPDGTEKFLYHVPVPAPFHSDTFRFAVQTEGLESFGLNYFYIKADAGAVASLNGDVAELDENNNTISSFKLFISADDLVPVWPYNYSIVSEQGVTLKASTVNAFAEPKQYLLQLDTTENFNSPLLKSQYITQSGGLVKWTPNITLKDSVVYYWRTSIDSIYGNGFTWHSSSFVYLPGSSPGFNQSHYFQFLSTIQPTGNVELPATRQFSFVDDVKTIGIYNGMTWWVGGPLQLDDPAYYLNGVLIGRWDCGGSGTSLLVAVIDSATGNFWMNPPGGQYFSIQCKATPRPYFQFNTYYPEHWGLWDLLDTIPDKNYILIMSMNNMQIWNAALDTFNWSALQIEQFTNLGLSKIAEIDGVVPYAAFLRKGDVNYPVQEVVGDTFTSIIDTSFSFTGQWNSGFIESPLIGPAGEWTSLHWKAHSLEAGSDHFSLQLLGIGTNGTETILSNNVLASDTSLSGINANQFPFLQLRLNCLDTLQRTPVQLDYWRIHYQPIPEAALNPAAFLELEDSINQYLPQALRVAIENVSPWDMDSLLMKYQLTDATNALHDFLKREQPLAGYDTIHARLALDTDCDCFVGNNFIYIEANPNDDQPEQFHFNNYGIIDFGVVADYLNPILDVTFDGMHIMDGDLVSAKPEIEIMLKDENKFVALNDTSAFDLYFIYPDGSQHFVVFDNVNAIFYPADSTNLSKDNTARLHLKKEFLTDGKYQLVVQGYDRSGNASGDKEYRISFSVINQPMISNVLNYPNPFTTSTRFVFTLTGSEVPQQMKITIYTVAGKVIREIFIGELGHLRMGNNITEFAFDGTDQFGDPLANGLYFYRIEALLNGQSMDHYENGTDQYFKKNIGKMYLMR
jgi:hypothetical protein